MSNADRSERPAIDVGTVLDRRFELLRLLGGGGMGFVFAARDLELGEERAVKVLRTDDGDATDTSATERLLREARFVQRVEHEHVVRVLECGRDDGLGCVFIVQELLRGEDLRARLKREGRLDQRTALELLEPIADALVAAHAAGVVHRDIKPENIFLASREDGVSPMLIDFGIAFAADPAVPTLTSTGTALGTPHYMSPEHVRGERPLDGRSDVWSLGVVLYECLAGRPPFEGRSAHAVIASIVTSAPSPVDSLANVDAPLAAVVARALERDRSLRFESAAALRDALRNIRDGRALDHSASFDLADSGGASWIDSLGASSTAKVARDGSSVSVAPMERVIEDHRPVETQGIATRAAPRSRVAFAAIAVTFALVVPAVFAMRRSPDTRDRSSATVATIDAANAIPVRESAVARADDSSTAVAPRALAANTPSLVQPIVSSEDAGRVARVNRASIPRREPRHDEPEPSLGAQELRRRFRNGAPVLPP